ncbi:MAG: energy transducer TonB [Gemmatimonadaceae bacterium]
MTPRPTMLRRALLVAVAGALSAAPAGGQASAAGRDTDGPRAAEACLNAIPADALTRVPVYLLATVRDSATGVILPGADILTDVVARRVREMLGAAPTVLPMGEPVVGWRDVDRDVVVTVSRDGDFSWRASDDESTPEPAASTSVSPAAELVMRALAAAHAAGERLPWPAGADGERLEFSLELSHGQPTREGAIVPPSLRVSIPVFSLAVPWSSPVAVTRPPRIGYPDDLARMGISGTIILEYMVGTDGRVDTETLHDVWRSPEPYPRGEMGHAYRGFIATVKRALPAARFEPARLGGCAVRQLVQQPFVFGIK